jgi:ABC-type protease/lipase transport system fused ATPase/permease subunit
MALAEHSVVTRPHRLSGPLERRLAGAAGLVLCAGLLGVAGALFVILLYGRLIPGRSLEMLAVAGGAALALVGLQAGARALAGRIADEASQSLFTRLEAEGEAARARGIPLIRALRGRSFQLAADLGWVPFFLIVVLVLHPVFGLAAMVAVGVMLRFGAAQEPPSPRPDAAFRSRERRRRLGMGSLRDGMQILLLTLGGALAIHGQVQMGEIVAATLLSLRAIGAVSAALDDAPALRAALASWRDIRRMDAPA